MQFSKPVRDYSPLRSRFALLGLTAAIFIGGTASGWCDESSDALLNLFIKKGLVTEKEAAVIKAEAETARTNNTVIATNDTRWFMSKGIKSMELFGDIRLRYEDRSASDPRSGNIGLQRLRYALRLGLRGDLTDDFYYGFRMDTGVNSRSPWVTLGTSATSSPYQGPFGKSNSGIGVGQMYLGWKPTPWLDVTIGKMPNPLYTTSLVWDSDIVPEGLAEHFKYSVGEADFFVNFGQFIYEDTNPTHASTGFFSTVYTSSVLPFMLAWQGGFNYHLTTNLTFKVGATLYNYTGRGADTTAGSPGGSPEFSGTYVGQGATSGPAGEPISSSGFGTGLGPYAGFIANQTGINDLLVMEIPFELNYEYAGLDYKIFGDYAQNLQGSQRSKAAFAAAQQEQAVNPQAGVGFDIALIPPGQTRENVAYQIGFAVGNKDSLGLVYGTTSRKHGWETRVYWQHIEQYALDPNLIDSDFFEGRENLQGIYAAAAYGITENLTGTVRYGYASRINKNLGTGGSNQDIPQMNPIQQFSLIQLDLSCRF